MRLFNKLFFVLISIYLVSCNSKVDTQITPSESVGLLNSIVDIDNATIIQKTESIYTSDRKISLTFSGLPDETKLYTVLNKLDELKIVATFFVPAQRAAEEPHLIELMVERGHKIENHSLHKIGLDGLAYSELLQDFKLSKQTIETITNQPVNYIRTEKSEFELPILKAAAQSQHNRYIGYSLYLTDQYLKEKFKKASDLRGFITRGGIIAIDLDRNEQINRMLELVDVAVNEVHYTFVTLDELIAAELPKKPYYDIEGYDLAKPNLNFYNQSYNQFSSGDTQSKRISLTIDDWGTDYTVTSILDILEEEDVIATFFLRANGVEYNPSLARAIVDAGHEVANHTYSHPIITTINPSQIQEEVIKSHLVLTEALQQAPAMLFRPPTGTINDRSAKIVAATGYMDIAMYDVTTLDWKSETTADDIYRIIKEKTTNGSIILLHMLDDINTIEALPKVITYLKEEGYQFVTTSELMKYSQEEE